MQKELYVNGQRLDFDPDKPLSPGGKGESYIYIVASGICSGKALKVFKEKADYIDTEDGYAALERITEHQEKLSDLGAQKLAERVILPEKFARDKNGTTILGYTMTFVNGAKTLNNYASPKFIDKNNITRQTVIAVFRDLYYTVSRVHNKHVVIGDFKDENVLARGREAYVIDADSFQFRSSRSASKLYRCKLWSTDFVDPRLIGKVGGKIKLVGRHDDDSDWYAYNVMLMRCLLFEKPYGGTLRIGGNEEERQLDGITIFDSKGRVQVPDRFYENKKRVPHELISHFEGVFERNIRGPFPKDLLDILDSWAQTRTRQKPYRGPSQADAKKRGFRGTDDLKNFIKRHKIGMAATAAIFAYVVIKGAYDPLSSGGEGGVSDAPANAPQEQIKQRKRFLQENPVFNWNVHNELRHLYITSNPPDPRRSMEHSNAIL